ncbi:malic enzyme [Colletotrichum salicis]|uniref:Malic enzyme n=1 Tax=Colletotrichum salicis TaxID=1209931 RepID=A0A135U5M4_9PEZI|nr:malic enzyme [Colletotrichum salicis]
MTDFNPMSSVDISVIEDKMRMASLDQHRGYSQNTFGEVQQYRNTEYVPKTQATAFQILREPLWNKGELITAAPPTYTVFPASALNPTALCTHRLFPNMAYPFSLHPSI